MQSSLGSCSSYVPDIFTCFSLLRSLVQCALRKLGLRSVQSSSSASPPTLPCPAALPHLVRRSNSYPDTRWRRTPRHHDFDPIFKSRYHAPHTTCTQALTILRLKSRKTLSIYTNINVCSPLVGAGALELLLAKIHRQAQLEMSGIGRRPHRAGGPQREACYAVAPAPGKFGGAYPNIVGTVVHVYIYRSCCSLTPRIKEALELDLKQWITRCHCSDLCK